MNEPILVGGKKFVTIQTAEFQNADIDLTLLFEGPEVIATSCHSIFFVNHAVSGMLRISYR